MCDSHWPVELDLEELIELDLEEFFQLIELDLEEFFHLRAKGNEIGH